MDVVNIILQKTDILDFVTNQYNLELKLMGDTYRGKCPLPLHNGNNETSFNIHGKQEFHCFACGRGGNVIQFVAEMEGITYHEAVEKLADFHNLDISTDEKYLEQKSIVQENEELARKYQKQVGKIMDYLTLKRGLSPEIIEKWGLGYDKEQLIIPIHDLYGRVVAFARRQFNKKPKYINSKNSPVYDKGSMLYGFSMTRKTLKKTKTLYVAEGNIDILSAAMQDLAAGAYCNNQLTKEQVFFLNDLLRQYPDLTVVLAPDNDEEGLPKLPKMREKFIKHAPKLNVRVLVMPQEEYEFCDGKRKCKDLNDVHVAGLQIAELETEHLDIFVLKQLLAQCSGVVETEYKVAEDFARTVKNPLILADIAQICADRWGKNPTWVRNYLDVKTVSVEDKLKLFKDPAQCVDEYIDIVTSHGIEIGYKEIDAVVKGVRPGDCVFLGAYSGVGKTLIAGQSALDMTLRQGLNVGFFSLEMTAGSLFERLIANAAQLPIWQVEEMAKVKDNRIYNAIANLSKKLLVVDQNNLSIDEIEELISLANTRKLERPLDVIIIDYLQYMAGTSDFEGISTVAKSLKRIAKQWGIVVVCISQLSRAGNPWVRPTLKELKGSGDIESSGDLIVMAHRPGLEPGLSELRKADLQDIIMLSIAKYRRGAIMDEFEYRWDKNTSRLVAA